MKEGSRGVRGWGNNGSLLFFRFTISIKMKDRRGTRFSPLLLHSPTPLLWVCRALTGRAYIPTTKVRVRVNVLQA
jgi:hypothetical protein